MRITNNIITRNTKTNINNNKVSVDRYNTQMTTQKKISKASEDPVIAIRSLRYSTTLSQLSQYADNNIPDAQSWLDVTQTALTNMKDLLKNVRDLCVSGSTDTKTADDRQTLLNQMTQLRDQVYEEGNADYGGRTVFTGYRTTSRMTFDADNEMIYDITENFSFKDMEEHRYYYGDVDVPLEVSASEQEVTFNDGATDIKVGTFNRIRLAYDGVTSVGGGTDQAPFGLTIKTVSDDGQVTYSTLSDSPEEGASTDAAYSTVAEQFGVENVRVYESEADWKKDQWLNKDEETGKTETEPKVEANDIIMIRDTGEVIFGEEVYRKLKTAKADISVTYEKQGFENGDLRPEFYFHCYDVTDAGISQNNIIEYNHVDESVPAERINAQGIEIQTIDYTIAANTTLTINTQAAEVFDSDIGRDVDELINVVQKAISAHDKVDQIKKMMDQSQYQDIEGGETNYQKNLQAYLDAAQKEADYADDNLQKTYSQYITNFNDYMETVNIALSNVGSTIDRLEMTQTRVENQKFTIEQLKTRNEDRDLSDIVIDYYAAYNAYTASLTAAGKIGDQSLLNYL